MEFYRLSLKGKFSYIVPFLRNRHIGTAKSAYGVEMQVSKEELSFERKHLDNESFMNFLLDFVFVHRKGKILSLRKVNPNNPLKAYLLSVEKRPTTKGGE